MKQQNFFGEKNLGIAVSNLRIRMLDTILFSHRSDRCIINHDVRHMETREMGPKYAVAYLMMASVSYMFGSRRMIAFC